MRLYGIDLISVVLFLSYTCIFSVHSCSEDLLLLDFRFLCGGVLISVGGGGGIYLVSEFRRENWMVLAPTYLFGRSVRLQSRDMLLCSQPSRRVSSPITTSVTGGLEVSKQCL